MSKQSDTFTVPQHEETAQVAEKPETVTEPQLDRIQQFLKAKAANQHHRFGKDAGHKPSTTAHTKLKERVRRRP